MNKPWTKPELVVLTRSTPEEGVLIVCKILAQGGANNANADCFIVVGCATACETISGS